MPGISALSGSSARARERRMLMAMARPRFCLLRARSIRVDPSQPYHAAAGTSAVVPRGVANAKEIIAIILGMNTFPPGNEQNVCDNRP